MKKRSLYVLCSALMFVSPFCGCNNDSDSESESDSGIQLRNFANSGCKPMETRSGDGQLPTVTEYIEYKGMDGGYLSLNHVNARFTCSSQLRMEASVSGSEITILEYVYHPTEEYISAACDCPYDLYGEVGPLAAGEYTVIIRQGEKSQRELSRFTIDYSKGLNGKSTIREWPWP